MKSISKTCILIRLLLVSLFLLGAAPCVVCPTMANATTNTEHDCCPGSEKDTPSPKSGSCCVISGYCVAATVPIVENDIPEPYHFDFSPSFEFGTLEQPWEFSVTVNEPYLKGDGPPSYPPSLSTRLALLQRLLI